MFNPLLPPHGFGIMFPYEYLIEIFKNEFELQFESEVNRTYDRVNFPDREVGFVEEVEYLVARFKTRGGDIADLITPKVRDGLYYISGTNSSTIERILKRFRMQKVDLCYEAANSEKASLENLKSAYEMSAFGYSWRITNYRSQELLVGYRKTAPEFIMMNLNKDRNVIVNFLYPDPAGLAQDLSRKLDDFYHTSYNTEHSVPSLKKEALENVQAKFEQLLDCDPLIRQIHEFKLSQGFKERFGRYR